jgi:hypothetical protein
MRRLGSQRCDDGLVVEHRDGLRQGGQSGLMRQDVSDGHAFLSSRGKSRPDLGDAQIRCEGAFLQRVQQTGCGQAFGRGPEEHRRGDGPGPGVFPILPARSKRNNFLAVAPDADTRAEFTMPGEVLLESIGERRKIHVETEGKAGQLRVRKGSKSGSVRANSRNFLSS